MAAAAAAAAADNIWDAAIALDRRRRLGATAEEGDSSTATLPAAAAAAAASETSLLVVGGKGAGKSTLIYRFLERQESAKPTLALEYTYGRKKNQDNSADVCHIWELGGGALFANLLETPLSPSRLPGLRVVLVVDLSEPHQLWFTLETLVSAIDGHIQRALKSPSAKELQLEDRLRLQGERRRRGDGGGDAEHPDKQKVRPMLVPLLILGSKYDEFQNLEPEKKKIVCRALRYFAHFHGATLQFHSAKDSGLLKKTRDVLSHLAFGTDAPSGMSQDYNKPLMVPAWSDSYQAITGGGSSSSGGDDGNQSGSGGGGGHLDIMKHHFTTHFPQSVDERTALGDDPAKDANFAEPEVDRLRAQKDDDLERYRKEIERRQRSADDFGESGRLY